MKNYFDLLKDVRWLLKRRVILKRDNYKCTVCGSKENLRVHHTYYSGDYCMPWEYPDDSLLTLCNKCHEDYHKTHELTFKGNPIKPPPKHKTKRKKKVSHNKNKKNKRPWGMPKKPRICLAIIQANRDQYEKLEDGTWVRKNKNEK